MRLVTWNVNSLAARKTFVSMFLDEVAPDVLCIQELKLPDERVPRDLFTSRGYEVAVHGQPRWNGVLIASRRPLADVHVGLPGDGGQSRLIAATIDGVRVVNLYCPQGGAAGSDKFIYKLAFYDALISWLVETCDARQPLIVTGDLNVAPQPQDVWAPALFAGVPTFHPEEHARWRQLEAWGLIDAARPFLPPNTYSFWDYRGGSFPRDQGMRIDHFLVTEVLRERVQGAQVLRDWRRKRYLDGDALTASDHAPVELLLAG